ncbi:MAG: FAD-binding oxidoreductase [Thermomicrobiales bacterium]|nr:FAD-binding oxidoreductase [Thermomicrobiales bacterium]
MTTNITDTVHIESPQHLSEVLHEASQQDQPVLPIGGGTCLSTGNRTDHGFLALDLTGLSGIDDYIPTDMTASFRAGTSLTEVRVALAENGQELPIDLAEDDGGTIGGLVATGFSGPRRLNQGTLKDLLIGCEYVRGDGLIAKAGGMTVKNVSGFEMSRLLHGSWGSLAVLTRVNLKVLPIARVDRTISWRDDSVSDGLGRQRTLLAALPMATSAQTVRDNAGVITSIRFVGRGGAVDDYLARAEAAVGAPVAESEGSQDWVVPQPSADTPVLICTAEGSELESVADSLNGTEGVIEVRISLGTTTLWASIDPQRLAIEPLTDLATGMWKIEGGSDTWKGDRSVWGSSREDFAVAQSVKNGFDPNNILNRGRLFV